MLSDQAISYLAWPTVALCVGLFALVLFRAEVRKLLSRVDKIEPGGVTLRSNPNTSPQPLESTAVSMITNSSSHEGSSKKSQNHITEFDSTILEEEIKNINTIINEERIPSESKESALIRYLASFRISTYFFDTYTIAFGSQIQLLSALTDGPISMQNVTEFFNLKKTEYPELHRERTVDDWLGYLSRRSMVTIEDNKVWITPMGRELCVWMTRRSITKFKTG